MKLYIMRHGEAVSPAENSRRPLSYDGLLEVKKIANFFDRNQLAISQIYYSEKLRAEQTALEVAKSISPAAKVNFLAGLLPDDDVNPIAVHCNQWQEDTLLVGHLPYVLKLARALLGCEEGIPCLNFETASVLCLNKIAPEQWCLSWFISPSAL